MGGSASADGAVISSDGNTCPKTGDAYLAKSVSVGAGVGVSQEANIGNRGGGASAKPGFVAGASAVPIKACSMIVLKEVSLDTCCTEKGKRAGGTIFQ